MNSRKNSLETILTYENQDMVSVDEVYFLIILHRLNHFGDHQVDKKTPPVKI